ncbi:1-acyl-sn-glycerol-3-phosphate acyltransferase gamma-like [Brachionus plicatilis]|uniref:1-acyl-sn-glycerol-3-phosphate acyltransferase gamma-like n=1 Tax=Brachionus plicatilis TaxID=10195 RepID=A0A3M7T3V6_BRAPC|nr:1-acyl-sn-glycerol-3-phosphate acyltransferase gamma-like [Brachionus plicatilis]
MSVLGQIKSLLPVQLMIVYIFFGSGLIVNLLQFLSYLIVRPFNLKLYRKINYLLAYSFWSNLTFLGQYWSGTDVHIYIDKESFDKITHEHFICIMNHKYDIDWLIGWIVCQRLGILGGSKIIGKSSLRFVPLIGWCWVFTESIFIDRKWESDKQKLKEGLDKNLALYPDGYFFNVLMFCEGTRFTKFKHEESMKIARAKGLPELKHHLLPRTKGFSIIARGAQDRVGAIYDLNVGIVERNGARADVNTIRKGIQLKGEIFIRRIPMSQVPTDEQESAKFIHKFYQEKDEIYDVFAKNGTFESLGVQKYELAKNYYDLYIALFWSTLLGVPALYWLYLFATNASLLMNSVLAIILLSMNFLAEMFVGISKIDKGSKYGLKEAETKKE